MQNAVEIAKRKRCLKKFFDLKAGKKNQYGVHSYLPVVKSGKMEGLGGGLSYTQYLGSSINRKRRNNEGAAHVSFIMGKKGPPPGILDQKEAEVKFTSYSAVKKNPEIFQKSFGKNGVNQVGYCVAKSRRANRWGGNCQKGGIWGGNNWKLISW